MCNISSPDAIHRNAFRALVAPATARLTGSDSSSARGADYRFGMGTIQYGNGDDIHIEDRALAHLKVVIATKLRRNESFTLSWRHPEGQQVGRSTIWLHPSIPLRFTFDEPEAPQLNPKWIQDLMHSASSTGGISLIDEVIDAPEVAAEA